MTPDLILPPNYNPSVVKELRSQSLDPNINFINGVPITDEYYDLTRAYQEHIWVYAAAWAIASNYAQLEYKAYRQGASKKGKSRLGMWEEYEGHPWLEMFKHPNPYMSAYTLKEFTMISLELTGNAYWALERTDKDDPSSQIKEIWPLAASQVRAVSSRDRLVDHYLFFVNGIQIQYGYDEMIHFQYANPASFIYGQGSLAAAKLSVMADLYSKTWNRNFFANAARPDAVFETDTVLTDDVRKRVMTQWAAMHRGVEKRGKTAVLEGGLKYKETNRTPKDLDFVSLQKLSREEILAAFGVPPSMCGLLESVNYATAKEQSHVFWKNTMIPKKVSIDEQLTMRIQQLSFDTETIFEADASKVEAMQIDELHRSRAATAYYAIGIPPNELIDALDLPFDPVKNGDLPFGGRQAPALSSSGGGSSGGGGSDGGGDGSTQAARVPIIKSSTAPATSQAKISHWKTFDIKLSSREEQMKIAVRSFFRGQKARVIKAFDAHAGQLIHSHVGTPRGTYPGSLKAGSKPTIDIHLIFNADKEQKDMRKATDHYIQGTYYDFAIDAGRKVDRSFDFSLKDPAALHWLDAKELNLVQQVTDTTGESISEAITDAVHDALTEGFDASETIAQITQRIDDIYQFAMEGRSELIARTEILGASNAGALEGMKQAGIETKEWLPSQETKYSRDWHQDMRGETAPAGEPFILGDGASMMFPGDPDGGPENICNCRCTIIAVVDN